MNNSNMKKTTFAMTLSTLLTLSSGAKALELLVVNNYTDAAWVDLWKKAKTFKSNAPV
jgi:hypothetical protein